MLAPTAHSLLIIRLCLIGVYIAFSCRFDIVSNLNSLHNLISKPIILPEAAIKKKLKTLKDKMRTVCASLPKTKSGQPSFEEATHVKWPFYHSMLFMKDQFIGRSMTSTLDEEDVDIEQDGDIGDDNEDQTEV